MPAKKAPPAAKPITSPKIKKLSAVGMATPSKLTNDEIRELAASVQRHIEPRGNPKKIR
jgi:hypothetical protein